MSGAPWPASWRTQTSGFAVGVNGPHLLSIQGNVCAAVTVYTVLLQALRVVSCDPHTNTGGGSLFAEGIAEA